MNPSNPESATEKDTATLRGYIIMLPYGGGSKSEGMRPVLLRENQKIARVCFHSDDPFTNATLWPYHMKYCHLHGIWEGTDLIAQSIEERPDPALDFPRPSPIPGSIEGFSSSATN